MDFEFSEEQSQLRNEIKRLLEDHGGIAPARAVMDGKQTHDAALWRAICEMGLPGAAIGEEYGGSDSGYLELCVVAEELGGSLAAVPMASSIYLAAEFLKSAGSTAQKQAWLPLLASGQKIGTFAGAELSGSIEAVFSDGVLNGVKVPVLDGRIADVAVVLARAGQGTDNPIRPFLVELSQAGVSRHAVETLDPTRPQARLEFRHARAELLEPAVDLDTVATVLNRAAVLVAFEQLGGAERALMMGRDYALERTAFGRKIGSFQAVKHMLADMFVSVALARGNAYYSAWALATEAPDLAAAAAGARISSTHAFRHCARNNIQVHGGMGFTWAFDCHLFYRRAQLLALMLGPPAYWEDQLIRHLPGRAA